MMLVTTIATKRQTTNSGSLTPVPFDPLERVADQDHHIEHEKRAQKPDMADVVDGLAGRGHPAGRQPDRAPTAR